VDNKEIVYILPDKDAGVASVIRNLLKFKTGRFKTKVILIHNVLDNSDRRIKNIKNADNIIRISYNGRWTIKYLLYRKIIKELTRNTVVVSNDGTPELSSLSYLKFSVPVVYVFHGDYKHYFNALKEKEPVIDKVISISTYLKDKIYKLGYHKRIVIKDIKFPVPKAKQIVRKTSDEVRLIFVGMLSDRKGVMSLPLIVEILEENKIPYLLSIIGSGDLEADLKNHFKKNNGVTFLGHLNNDDVFKKYTEHDIILLPSKGEGLPVVIVEAMKHGVVPMATNLKSGIPELIEHNVNGYTIPLGNHKKYADYIIELYKDQNLLKKMSLLCIKKSEDLFNPQKQTRIFEDEIVSTKTKDSKLQKSFMDFLPAIVSNKIKSFF
jgi:glycosyltransferase involved in cell wall biosynthesis